MGEPRQPLIDDEDLGRQQLPTAQLSPEPDQIPRKAFPRPFPGPIGACWNAAMRSGARVAETRIG